MLDNVTSWPLASLSMAEKAGKHYRHCVICYNRVECSSCSGGRFVSIAVLLLYDRVQHLDLALR